MILTPAEASTAARTPLSSPHPTSRTQSPHSNVKHSARVQLQDNADRGPDAAMTTKVRPTTNSASAALASSAPNISPGSHHRSGGHGETAATTRHAHLVQADVESTIGAKDSLFATFPVISQTNSELPTFSLISAPVHTMTFPLVTIPSQAPATILTSAEARTYSFTPPSMTFHSPSSSHIAVNYSPTTTSTPSDQASPSSNLRTIAVIALGVTGIFFLCAAIFIFVRCVLCRPRRHSRVVPSKPIPQGELFEEESPIFGPKERFDSIDTDGTAPVLWTQYSPDNKPAAAVTPTYLGWNTPADEEKGIVPDISSSKSIYPFVGHGNSDVNVESQTTESVLPSVGTALRRSLSRLSSASSLFLQVPTQNFGVAISDAPLTGDYLPAIQRVRPIRESLIRRQSQRVSAYGGLVPDDLHTFGPLPSPVPRSASAPGGRARIKNAYASGHFKRPSVPAVRAVKSATNEDALDDDAIIMYNPTWQTDNRRTRDAKALTALTAVLSYAEEPSSPQMTIRPEDSMSIVAERREIDARIGAEANRRQKELMTKSVVEANTALGSLMLMDFGPSSASKSLKSLKKSPNGQLASLAGDGELSAKPVGPLKVQKRPAARWDDVPPRVPSPPPLPSLEQMAMHLENPEAYDSYRSPTYSLYACYGDEDRQSRLALMTNAQTLR